MKYLLSAPTPKHLEAIGQIIDPSDPAVSNSFKTTAHQFRDYKQSKVAEQDYQNFALFMQDMNQL